MNRATFKVGEQVSVVSCGVARKGTVVNLDSRSSYDTLVEFSDGEKEWFPWTALTFIPEKTKVLASDLRLGDVVRLEGSFHYGYKGTLFTVSGTADEDGDVRVKLGELGDFWVNDSAGFDFFLVRRAGEAALAPVDPLSAVDDMPDLKHGAWAGAPDDTETFTAKVGTWLWACAKAEQGEKLQVRGPHDKGQWHDLEDDMK